MPEFSICIASRGNPLGLWATIHACKAKGIDAEYLVFLNGQEKEEPHILLEERASVKIFHCRLPVAPPIARDFVANEASGDLLCFLDDHVLPVGDFFDAAQYQFMANKALGVLHSSYQPYCNGDRYYHFVPDLEMPTRGDYSKQPLSDVTYPCLSGPHGGFFVRRSTWNALGGYGDWFQGFGGEEAYFGMKARLAGHEVCLDPRLLFYHFSCRPVTRGYDKNLNHWNYEEGMRQLGDVSAILREELWEHSPNM